MKETPAPAQKPNPGPVYLQSRCTVLGVFTDKFPHCGKNGAIRSSWEFLIRVRIDRAIRIRHNKTLRVTHDKMLDGLLDFMIRNFKTRASGRRRGLTRKLHKGHPTRANIKFFQFNRH